MTRKGVFVVFEGIDGSGTSTHVHTLEERIEILDKYQDVLRTHEPWRSDEIKRRLKEDSEIYSDGAEIARLFVDDRKGHTKNLILPNLELGVVVLDSRYKMSTCAYQWAQGVSLTTLLEMHEHRGILTPDLTFFMDVPREVARERIRSTRGEVEKFEKDPEFIDKLTLSYNILIDMSEADLRLFGKVVRINGNRDIREVADEIYKEFLKVYKTA